MSRVTMPSFKGCFKNNGSGQRRHQEEFLIFSAAGKTHQGMVRVGNEDSIAVNEKLGLVIVADGMGGHAAGETASRLATEAISDDLRKAHQPIKEYDDAYSETTNRLNAAIMRANSTVYEAAQSSPELAGMGTTVAAAWLQGNQLSYAHIGDSRIYLIRSGNIEQLTEDHSLVQEQRRSDPDALDAIPYPGMKNILTRAVGLDTNVRADLGELTILEGDMFLLCSDGLHNMISDDEILKILLHAGNVQAACEILIDAANDRGGKDNISAIVGYIRRKKWYWPFLRWIKTFRR